MKSTLRGIPEPAKQEAGTNNPLGLPTFGATWQIKTNKNEHIKNSLK